MIAGPNGAGKTTVAKELLSSSSVFYEYMNADEIAKGLAPNHPESVSLTASKLMISRLKELLKINKNFAFETTAAGSNYVKYLKEAKSKGYEINLFFLWLTSPEQAAKRVTERVKQGGHHIPKEIIHRRYYAGLTNLITLYLPITDRAIIIDNSTEEPIGKLIARKKIKNNIEIIDSQIWEKILRVRT